jgi:hypothetical protein
MEVILIKLVNNHLLNKNIVYLFFKNNSKMVPSGCASLYIYMKRNRMLVGRFPFNPERDL